MNLAHWRLKRDWRLPAMCQPLRPDGRLVPGCLLTKTLEVLSRYQVYWKLKLFLVPEFNT